LFSARPFFLSRRKTSFATETSYTHASEGASKLAHSKGFAYDKKVCGIGRLARNELWKTTLPGKKHRVLGYFAVIRLSMRARMPATPGRID
jgi:hypothetical protein